MIIQTFTLVLLWLMPQTTPQKRCQAPEYRQFDFWIGSWDVEDARGNPIGRSRIEPIEAGCGIQENWTDRSGLTGRSLNAYRPASKVWTQLWAASWGSTLLMEGRYENERMAMSGDVVTPTGETPRQRTTWSRLDGGGVRQLTEWSRDGGRTWTVVFDGRYRHAGASQSH
jgi:hypothetical protein